MPPMLMSKVLPICKGVCLTGKNFFMMLLELPKKFDRAFMSKSALLGLIFIDWRRYVYLTLPQLDACGIFA